MIEMPDTAYVLRDAAGRAILIGAIGPDHWEFILQEMADAGPGSTLTIEPTEDAKAAFVAAMQEAK